MRDFQPARRPRPLIVLATVSALLIALLAVPGLTPSAQAGLYNPIPTDGDMNPTFEFFTNDNLFAYATSDIRGGSACVVPASMTGPSGDCDSSGAAGWSPNRIVGIGSTLTLIQGAPLRVGQWKIMTTDSVGTALALSEAFTVSACTPDMSCDTSIANAEARRLKDAVTSPHEGAALTCLGFNAKDAHDTATRWQGGARTVGVSHEVFQGGWGSFGMAVGVGAGLGLGFSFPDFGNPGEAKALEILKELTCNVQQMYKDIIDDPPDPNFATVVDPIYAPSLPSGSADTDALATSLDRQRAYGMAMRVSLERYQGALAARDLPGQLRQLDAIVKYADQLDQQSQGLAGSLRLWAEYSAGVTGLMEPVFATESARTNTAAVYQRVRTSGFSPDELTQLSAGGFNTPALQAKARAAFSGEPTTLPVGETLATRVGQFATNLEDSREEVRSWSNYVAAIAAQLRVPINQPPVATFTVTPNTGSAPLTVSVDASASRDPDGTIASYAWTFGDGATDSGATARHTYTGVGTATITLTVTDDEGATAQSTRQVTTTAPAPNVAPVASFKAVPASGTAPLTVALDASASSDSDGQIVSYEWDFGEGPKPAGPVMTQTLTAPGSYTVVLTITDNRGATAQASQKITVTAAVDGAPVAVASASPTAGTAPLAVQFHAGESTDGEGPITAYRWSFGDGTESTEVDPSHTFTDPGIYGVALSVTDNAGNVSSTIVQITVLAQENTAPVAAFTADPMPGSDPLEVALDASSSSDTDGVVVSWEWDLGDGFVTTGPQVKHTYSNPGTFTVQLRVTDDVGAQDLTSQQVEVKQGSAAFDDVLTLHGGPGPVDLFANDTAADRDGLRVESTSAPENGTLKCGPRGGCTYSPGASYEGEDTFTYVMKDALGAKRTASVLVQGPGALTVTSDAAASASPDHAWTHVGVPVTIDVLANDTGGAPLRVEVTGTPVHGGVTCAATCRFAPEAGYTGVGGFTYAVTDANGQRAESYADVRILPTGLVGPPTVGTGSDVVEGSRAPWEVLLKTPAGMPVGAPGSSEPLSADLTLDGRHTIDTLSTSAGWASTIAGDRRGAALTATDQAALGDRLEAPIPPPLPPISQGTGGDGHMPILVGSKVFAFFHHSNPTSVSCLDRATGRLCPGYPIQVSLGSTDINGPGAVIGTKMWVHLFADRNAESLFCWDAATDQTCGFTVLERHDSVNGQGSHPVLVDGTVRMVSATGQVLCLDPSSGSECPRTGAIVPNTSVSSVDVIAHGSRLFHRIQGSSSTLGCADVTTGSHCAGWGDATALSGRSDIVTELDTQGRPTGICLIDEPESTCHSLDDFDDTRTVAGLQVGDGYYNISSDAIARTRVFRGSLINSGLACFDWATRAPCAGANFDSGGWVSTDTNNSSLPSAYGTAFDGACVVAVGDPGQVFTVAPDGTSPCTSLTSGISQVTSDLRMQRCDGTTGRARWASVTLLDEQKGVGLSAITVTVRDSLTGKELVRGDLRAGSLDLTAVDPMEHPSLDLSASVTSLAGNPAWADGVAPRVVLSWVPDAQVACVMTLTVSKCEEAVGPLGLTANFGTTVGSATGSVQLKRSGSCEATSTPTPTPTTTSTLTTTPTPTPTTTPTPTASPVATPTNTPTPPPSATPTATQRPTSTTEVRPTGTVTSAPRRTTPASAQRPALSYTGTEIWQPLALGMLLALAGLGLVVASRLGRRH